MTIDFDVDFDSSGLNSLKWEFVVRDGEPEHWDRTNSTHGEDRVLPMWVADMDFRVAEPIVAALKGRVERGIFGYAGKSLGYVEAVVNWIESRHGWSAEKDWVVPTVGIVPALHMIVRQFTKPGEGVLIQRPVYHPFTYAVENNNRQVVCNPLQLEGNRYSMDFADLESKAQDPQVSLAILCNPHNPVGRVWSEEEIARFAEICTRHGVLVVSDEIHGDLVLPGNRLASYGRLDLECTDNSIVCTAASKTFNLAGLKTSSLIIRNAKTRARMKDEIRASGLWGLSLLGLVATEAAFKHGESWLEAVIEYISGNHDFVARYIQENIPQLQVIPPEATYLSWIDCRALGLPEAELSKMMMEEAKIYLDDGYVFGPEGSGFIRLNIACRRSQVEQALVRLSRAVERKLTG